MKTTWTRLKTDLFFLLLLIFLATGIGIILVLWAVNERLEDYENEIQVVAGEHYMRQFISEIGSTQNNEELSRLVENAIFDLRITGPDINWSSHPDVPDPKDLHFQSFPHHEIQVGFSFYRTYPKMKSGDHTYLFAIPKMDQFGLPDQILIVLSILTSVLILTGSYFLVRRLFRPIEIIKSGAVRIGNGELTYRLPETNTQQMNELVVAINKMAGDLGEMLEAKRQLLLAISHELRSPLTRARVSLEFVKDPNVKADLQTDITDMERMVTELLESERLNSGHQTLQVESVPMVEFVTLSVSEQFPKPGRTITLDMPEDEFYAEVDPIRIRLLIKNIVENALRYAKSNVFISLTRDLNSWYLNVKDDGPGIPESQVDRLTDPFYRIDPSRQRKTGGFGLGLYLCHLITKAHNGKLEIHNHHGQGAVITIGIPFVATKKSPKK